MDDSFRWARGQAGAASPLRGLLRLLAPTTEACEAPMAAVQLAGDRTVPEATDRLTALLVPLAVSCRAGAGPSGAELAAAVEHEVRTPLASIHGYAELLADSGVPVPERHLDTIRRNARRLTRTIDHLLCGGAGAAFDRRIVDLATLTATRVGLRGAGEAITVHCPPTAVPVEADSRGMACAIDNLIDNAVTHNEPGTPVTVTLGADATLSVRDAGRGVPEAERRRVVTAFYRGERARADQTPGLGLGLTVTDRIVTAHGGRLRIGAAPGRGTTATISLPPAP